MASDTYVEEPDLEMATQPDPATLPTQLVEGSLVPLQPDPASLQPTQPLPAVAGGNVAQALMSGSLMFPSDLYTKELDDQVTAELQKLDDDQCNDRFQSAKAHPEFPRYCEGVRAEIGDPEIKWEFGEEEPMLDLVMFEVWVRAKRSLAQQLGVPPPPPFPTLSPPEPPAMLLVPQPAPTAAPTPTPLAPDAPAPVAQPAAHTAFQAPPAPTAATPSDAAVVHPHPAAPRAQDAVPQAVQEQPAAPSSAPEDAPTASTPSPDPVAQASALVQAQSAPPTASTASGAPDAVAQAPSAPPTTASTPSRPEDAVAQAAALYQAQQPAAPTAPTPPVAEQAPALVEALSAPMAPAPPGKAAAPTAPAPSGTQAAQLQATPSHQPGAVFQAKAAAPPVPTAGEPGAVVQAKAAAQATPPGQPAVVQAKPAPPTAPPPKHPAMANPLPPSQLSDQVERIAMETSDIHRATSVTHRREWMVFSRAARNPSRMVQSLVPMYNDSSQKTDLFRLWLQNGQSFQACEVEVNRRNSLKQKAATKEKWMSKRQLELEGRYSAEDIKALIEKCTNQGQWIGDPNFPERQDLRQYCINSETTRELARVREDSQNLTSRVEVTADEASEFLTPGGDFAVDQAPTVPEWACAPCVPAPHLPAEVGKGKGKGQKRKKGKDADGEVANTQPDKPKSPLEKALLLQRGVLLGLTEDC